MVLAIERITTCQHLKAIIRDEIYATIKQEADQLLVNFRALDAGLTSCEGGTSIRSVAYYRPNAAAADNQDHVAAVYDWLKKDSSPLRSAIALFSSGGLFYVAQCHEKGARAWLAAGHTREDMQAAVTSRGRGSIDRTQAEIGGLSTSA